jgi:hypothetical protein
MEVYDRLHLPVRLVPRTTRDVASASELTAADVLRGGA